MLQAEDGRIYRGTHEIFAHLRGAPGWEYAADHRRRFKDHRIARESDAAGRLLKQFRGGDLDSTEPRSSPDEATVVDVPEENRYELLLGDRRIGLLAYHRRGDRIAFTHTEVTPACEGRGFGSRLVKATRSRTHVGKGLVVAPLCPVHRAVHQAAPEYADLVAPEHRRVTDAATGATPG